MRNPTTKSVGAMTLRQFVEAFILDPDEQGPRTLERINDDLKRFERCVPDNPVLSEFTHETAAEFRRQAVADGLSATTINQTWVEIRRCLRRAAPPVFGNPRGMGLLFKDGGLPYMKPVRGPRKRLPYRIPLEDLSRCYVHGAKTLNVPRTQSPCRPLDWWRTLMVVAYTTGMRRNDLIGLKWDQIDFDNATLDLTAGKTFKSTLLPLHKAAVDHLSRIRHDVSPYVFGGAFIGNTGRIYTHLRGMQRAAGVTGFSLQNIRQTAAAEIDRVAMGMSAVLLQHAPRTVTERFYLQKSDELREALDQMRMPIGFNSGAKMANTADRKREEQAVRMRPHDFDIPTRPVISDWQFGNSGFTYRDRWYELNGLRLWILRFLVEASGPVSSQQLQAHLASRNYKTPEHQVSVYISKVRNALRDLLRLGDWNPLPCVERREGAGGTWQLRIPHFARPDAELKLQHDGAEARRSQMATNPCVT